MRQGLLEPCAQGLDDPPGIGALGLRGGLAALLLLQILDLLAQDAGLGFDFSHLLIEGCFIELALAEEREDAFGLILGAVINQLVQLKIGPTGQNIDVNLGGHGVHVEHALGIGRHGGQAFD